MFADGFESGNLSNWTSVSGLTVQRSTVHSGSWAARAAGSGKKAYAYRSFASTYPELHARESFYVSSRSTNVWVGSLRQSGGAAIALVGMNATAKLIVRNAVRGVTYASSTVVTTGAWHEVVLHVLVGSAGRIDVSYDGAPIAALSRTGNLGTAPIGRFQVGESATGRTYDVAIDDVSVATDAGPSDREAPTQPTGLAAATVDATQVDLRWVASTDDVGVVRYDVYRSLLMSTGFSLVGSSPGTTYRDSGLTPNTTYWWVVEAVDAASNPSLRSDVASTTTDPPPSPDALGQWSAPFDVGVPAVHAAVLHTGEVLMFYRTAGSVGTVAKLWDPETGQVVDVSLMDQHNLFCAGHSFLPNGDLLVTGGTVFGGSNPNGTTQTAIFDPDTRTWRRGPTMLDPRWYPTNVTLPDGHALIVSGQTTQTMYADEVEEYAPESDAISTLPPTATLQMNLYPRMFLLADGRLVRVGTESLTKYFEPSTDSWSDGPQMRVGPRAAGSAVLLPDLTRVLAIGGHQSNLVTNTTEIVDLEQPSLGWRYSAPMANARRNLNAVLLPDEKVLVVGGNLVGNYDSPVMATEMFDPATETWTTMAAHAAPRAYHSTAVLLPDGRVLSAGQTSGTQQTTAEVYSPPYLFRGPRPVIGTAPSNVAYLDTFTVGTPDTERISRVALVRPDSVTHSVHFDQRYVPLQYTSSSGALSVVAPAANEGPPGWYMLFLIDDDGVPSVASWVHLS